MDSLIPIGGYHINPSAISFVDCRKPGITTVHIGANALVFEGAESKKLRELYPTPEAVPGAGAATSTEAHASLEHAKSLWTAPASPPSPHAAEVPKPSGRTK